MRVSAQAGRASQALPHPARRATPLSTTRAGDAPAPFPARCVLTWTAQPTSWRLTPCPAAQAEPLSDAGRLAARGGRTRQRGERSSRDGTSIDCATRGRLWCVSAPVQRAGSCAVVRATCDASRPASYGERRRWL